MKAKTPFVERVRFTSAKGFRMMMVASVQSMVVVSRYALLPSGEVVPAASDTSLTGSLFGKSGRIHSTATYGGFQPAR
ncbi:hypothetical protein LK533_06915 [Sphingomonas sp. PL-96]|uniref:hypothetical protein n=1 Tax=Sphingomonas sp. PL-96 TaxID=2887201 RepID=UPI001E48A84C|nr:hypothetical protein [Sphingomonas sp. PL-96]MCC2976403.1 hypothetical protein [Sphingomonas sp. PL-96]